MASSIKIVSDPGGVNSIIAKMPGKSFPKNAKLEIPYSSACIVYQDGNIAGCVKSAKGVALNKKHVRNLKVGFFSSTVDATLYYVKDQCTAIRTFNSYKGMTYGDLSITAYINHEQAFSEFVKSGKYPIPPNGGAILSVTSLDNIIYKFLEMANDSVSKMPKFDGKRFSYFKGTKPQGEAKEYLDAITNKINQLFTPYGIRISIIVRL